MNHITPHTAITSLFRALEPGEQMIDGRSEQDRLWFLSEFAGLLNFYNSSNQRQGSWKPMLLKDPVFLLAAISKTSYTSYYSRYSYTCSAISSCIAAADKDDKLPAYRLLEQLFRRLYDVYQQISCWTCYMVQGIETYNLKTYVSGQVQRTFSPCYWSLMVMRKYLFINCRALLNAQPAPQEGQTDYFGTALWQQNKGSAPWWEILGFTEQPAPLDPASPDDDANYLNCFTRLTQVAEDLFAFFRSIITNAAADYDKQALVKSHYPDTTLLRTFIKLLGVQQQQLNGLAAKHLDFYYQDILQQKPLPARPDTAFLCAALKTATASYTIPAGTGFMAGTDAAKNPVVFSTTSDQVINPAILTGAAVLSFITSGTAAPGLYADEGRPVAAIQYQASGQAESLPSFGGSITTFSRAASMGIAFASPMFCLPEGSRTITCNFQFTAAQDTPVLNDALFFLSTEKSWLQLQPGSTPQAAVAYTDAAGSIITTPPYAGAQLTITLDAVQPPIQAFADNPDGYTATWPLLKLLFPQLTTAATPPCIQSLTITTAVTGLKNLRLYNDNGALSAKDPFAPYGPVPLRNSNFIIGSTEIFSKPFTQLSLQLNWSNLPAAVQDKSDNFETYYSAYNAWCKKYAVNQEGSSHKLVKAVAVKAATAAGIPARLLALLKWAGSKLVQGVKWVVQKVKSIFTGSSQSPALPFNNGCFTTGFSLLSNGAWQSFAMEAPAGYTTPGDAAGSNTVLPYDVSASMFRVNETDQLLAATSIFNYPAVKPADEPADETAADDEAAAAAPAFVPDPMLQQNPLSYTETTASGFMRMTLTGPAPGFGSELYPAVVGWLATENAVSIAKSADWFFWGEPVLAQTANMPFSPLIGSISADYTATVQYSLTAQSGSYPLQCYLYSPFGTSTVYNNVPGQALAADAVITNIGGLPDTAAASGEADEAAAAGVPLFPAFVYAGALFLRFSQLLSGTLNLFTELSGRYYGSSSSNKLYYRYLSPQGWKPLPLLYDGTAGFTCSGITRLSLPSGFGNPAGAMPGEDNWICIAATGSLSAFAGTVYINANGFPVQRSGTAYLTETSIPVIAAGTITRPLAALPALESVVQPFASAGGAACENTAMMNRRVSIRIKTKDRLITQSDFYAQLCRQFSFLFYCKVYTDSNGATGLYLVRRSEQDTSAGAWLPFVSTCQATEVQEYISGRIQPFSGCAVQNFTPQYISIYAVVTPLKGYSEDALKRSISQALNTYLSPWISSTQKQAVINQPITGTDIAGCLMDVEGVGAVTEVRFRSMDTPPEMPCSETDTFEINDHVAPASPVHIMVSSRCHTVQFNNAA